MRLTALACLLVVAAACSGNDSPPAGPGEATGPGSTGASAATGPVPDACSLISSDEIEALTRTHPGAGSTSGSEDHSMCIYENGLTTAALGVSTTS